MIVLFMQVLRSLGNLVAGDSYITDAVLIVGQDITGYSETFLAWM